MTKPIIRCSELPQLLSCGGSRTLKAIIKNRQGDESTEGTLVHLATAWRIVKELGAEQPDGGLPVAMAVPRNAEWMVNYFFNHARHEFPQDWALSVEAPFAYEFERFILSGHMDIHGVNRDATDCRGSDWKCVYKPQLPASENEQVLGYICLQAMAYPNLQHMQFDLLQPRIDEDLGIPRTSTIELDRTGIEACVSSLNDRVNAALDKPYELETGLTQCAWCSAAMQCPAIHAEIEFMKAMLTPEILARIKSEADDATLGDIVIAGKILDRPFEDAKDLIKQRIAAQGYVDAGNGTRITAKVTKGAFKPIDPVGLYRTIKGLVADEARLAKALTFPLGRLTDAVAEEMGCPATGRADITAEKIVKAQLHPFCEQGERTTLSFST